LDGVGFVNMVIVERPFLDWHECGFINLRLGFRMITYAFTLNYPGIEYKNNTFWQTKTCNIQF
jgi:hypothetical protein